MTDMICMGPQLLETNECLIATQPDQLHFDDAWACLSRFATAADGIHK